MSSTKLRKSASEITPRNTPKKLLSTRVSTTALKRCQMERAEKASPMERTKEISEKASPVERSKKASPIEKLSADSYKNDAVKTTPKRGFIRINNVLIPRPTLVTPTIERETVGEPEPEVVIDTVVLGPNLLQESTKQSTSGSPEHVTCVTEVSKSTEPTNVGKVAETKSIMSTNDDMNQLAIDLIDFSIGGDGMILNELTADRRLSNEISLYVTPKSKKKMCLMDDDISETGEL